MSDPSSLIDALREALAAAPENNVLRKHLGDLLFEAGEYSEAVQHYRKALDGAPHDSQIKLQLAAAYERMGKAEVSLVVLEELLSSGNPEAQVLLQAARLYLDCGAPAEAALAYRRAVAAEPGLADLELESRLPQEKAEPQTKTREPGKLFLVSEEADEDPLVEVERPKTTFADVGGMEKVKEEIRMKIIYPIQKPELFKAYGKKAGGGILMYGPPG